MATLCGRCFLFNGSYGASLRGARGLLSVPPFVPIILEENRMRPLDFP